MSPVVAAISGHRADDLVTAVVVVLAVVGVALHYGRRLLAMAAGALGAAIAVVLIILAATNTQSPATPTPGSVPKGLAYNQYLDPGGVLSKTAPGFTLRNQFGMRVSLAQFRGKVVLLAFSDSECTTICPLTTTAMLDAKAMLGAAGRNVQLLGIDANPDATAVRNVWSYSEVHGMLHSWEFLTGTPKQLATVWKRYAIYDAIVGGQIDHTPALYVISPAGLEKRLYVTQQSYSAVPQLGQLVAQEMSAVIPGHPKVHSDLSYAQVPVLPPTHDVSLPLARTGSVALGPGQAHLTLFFATWDTEVTDLARRLSLLDDYQRGAGARGLPRLTAVDEASVEPSSHALESFMATLPNGLNYPVAVDRSGRLADGYEVQDEPWFVLTSPTGRILWFWDVSTSGWLSTRQLIAKVRAGLAKAPTPSTAAASATHALAGSPTPLAALHAQASRLLGGESALAARIRALRGYPIVINIWASWCDPCRAEFGVFARASVLYGKRVAFLGADYSDTPSSAQPFLAQHRVSYPSYQAGDGQLGALAPGGINNLPMTVILGRSGSVVHTNLGPYLTQAALDQDIDTYALKG